MSTTSLRPTEPANTDSPPPFPEGWYFLESRRAVEKAKLIRKTWMGESIIIWCDDDGRICVAESHCPHLGADLGPEAGGRVCDGRLVCPFHGFEYDAGGQCVATPFAPAPKAARLRVFETTEVLGLIFAWWGIGDRPPQWNLHPDPLDQTGWSSLSIQTLRFPSHPQETAENAVDLAHFRYVHGYHNVSRIEPVSVDGHCLLSRFDFASKRRIAGFPYLTLNMTATTHVWGLGCSFVEVREHSTPFDMRFWVLATPVDGRLIDLSLVTQVGGMSEPKRRIAGLGFLPGPLRARVMNRILTPMQKRDVLQDVKIWSRKQHLRRPRLARSDGEIMRYRAYCRQFYPAPPGSNHNDKGDHEVREKAREKQQP
ncbi:MAG: Rieske 2Fe-2S domain-containing protein [Acidimicrobiia bacterium]|nr:Rieske 2Fe-2S domain-containing protein [Acidimicrobiia bacterium]